MTSAPAEISSTCERRALGVSRVTMIGGLGLFLEPAGRPLGRRVGPPLPLPPPPSPPPPELVAAVSEDSIILLLV